ncbi:DUF1345 domain-containing protein [Hymenobacter sp. BT770]|uniref:DUF1345 domain-containing protein n=1 Tax=Hymenobacter sp. BT770 TaxID=2886942 RepID=UPI001D0FC1AA|nr:DUF1345 domain-containing protein [Hymenobacter sp. BT770]MCC3154506.1 DUF1345 domain-containing protein [Hymenobacter sp. BT770]MDO3416430.1 DUF1345 domain-containing protein [Hymenobacter sp. BT770]
MPQPSALFRYTQRIGQLSATYRLLIGLGLGAAAWFLAPPDAGPISRWVASWDVCATATLLLIAAAMFTADAASIRKVANSEDPSRTLAFGFVLVAALASLLAVVALLGTMKSLSGSILARHIVLSAAAVLESWLLVHTVFTLHYAHIYYDADDARSGADTGGLGFPGEPPEPDYLDFAYFAFTIGMAAQTADVTIPGRRQRRTALLHALISFGFNTAIVALSISALGSLL